MSGKIALGHACTAGFHYPYVVLVFNEIKYILDVTRFYGTQ